MLVKVALLAVLAASTPLFFAAAPQDPADEPEAPASPSACCAEAQARADALQRQLDECLDMLEQDDCTPRHNCSPSRGQRRTLMTQYQWLRRNGHDQRAERALTRLVESVGDDAHQLNNAAWHLMTDDATQGQFDEVALALMEHLQARGDDLPHHVLDTAALAKFLGGKVDEAIELQRRAVAHNEHDGDYRRRLRTYEAARTVKLAQAADQPAAAERADEPQPEKSLHE